MDIMNRIIRRLFVRAAILLLTVAIAFSSFATGAAAEEAGPADAMIGKYVTLGGYLNEPVKYRIIHAEDVNGDGIKELLLFADRIISLKPFDASGDDPGGRGGTSRKGNGSNLWSESNMRDWLNSDQPQVQWNALSPESIRVWNGYNAYADEGGFLSQGNMTDAERSFIVPVTHRHMLAAVDDSLKSGGAGDHQFLDASISTALANYDSARYGLTTDGVFLLSLKELKEYVVDRFPEQLTGYVTDQALEQSNSIYDPANSGIAAPYWTRDAVSQNSYAVRYVAADLKTPLNGNAITGTRGVRPAMYLKSDLQFTGEGTKQSPFSVTREADPVDTMIGKYVSFGSYLNEPVKYRVIHAEDVNGDGNKELLLFADRIISLKPFDASGDDPGGRGGTSRKGNGSNLWSESNMRDWLNSHQQQVQWNALSPRTFRVWNGYNAYAGEQGFLSQGNMKAAERSVIVPVTHRHMLAAVDDSLKSGGAGDHQFLDASVSTALANYDSARYGLTTDSVFLLSLKELKEYVVDRFPEKLTGYATDQALEQSNSIYDPANSGIAAPYWTRDAVSQNSNAVRYVAADLKVPLNGNAITGTRGVRPAMYLKSGLQFTGDGTEQSPFAVSGLPEVPEEPGAGTNPSEPFPAHHGEQGIHVIVRNNDLTSSTAEQAIASGHVDGITYYSGLSVLEPTEGVYNWDYIDEMIYLSRKYGKPLKIAILPGRWVPEWVYTKGAVKFNWNLVTDLVDPGSYDASAPVPWDPVYLSIMENMIKALSARYADEAAIGAVQVTGPSLSNGLETNLVLNDYDVTRIGYTSDKLIGAWKRMIDAYDQAFPNKSISLLLNNYITQQRNNEIPRELRDYAFDKLGPRLNSQIAYITYEDWFERGNEGIEIWAEASDRMKLQGQLIDVYSVKKANPEYLYEAIRKAASMGSDMIEVFAQDLVTPVYAAKAAEARELLVNKQPSGVVIVPSSETLTVGESAQWSAKLIDQNGYPISAAPLQWNSGDEAVATVNVKGGIMAISEGSTVIRAVYAGKLEASAELRVYAQPRLRFNKTRYSLTEGDRLQTVVELVYKGTNIDVTAGADILIANPRVAVTTTNGMISAYSEGTTVISATYKSWTASAELIVTAYSSGGDWSESVDGGTQTGGGPGQVGAGQPEVKPGNSAAKGVALTLNDGSIVTITEQQIASGKVLIEAGKARGSTYSLDITGAQLTELATRNADLELEFVTPLGSYKLPLQAARTDKIGNLLQESLGNLTLTLSITKADAVTVAAIRDGAIAFGAALIGEPLHYELKAENEDGKQLVVVSFDRYVSRSMHVDGQLDAKTTVGVYYDPVTGSYTPVPTIVTSSGEKTSIELKRRGNSIYALLQVKPSFADLAQHWSREDVEALAAKLIVKGKSELAFDPDGIVTRAEWAAMLTRALALESDGSLQERPFADAEENWFTEAVSAVHAAGLMNGYEDGTFRPLANITREEIAVVLERVSSFTGKRLALPTDTGMVLGKFNDAGQVGSWAQTALASVVAAKIMQGDEQGRLAPNSSTTRAETAVLLKRMLVYSEFMNP
ncbi:hypothetical protein GC102_36885 [Paenibacillus sp. LMG 31460]|uniref:SLH domain-containing protein n=1 Tax=Paenibacillus germinis TaxID=2654979 RepID=A0ABX1ZHC3_9BACL|nr:S-layer homology domain-containing protein [Paenibacillus germinis]NOU91261.1 hypothetical protein [Paenibacillus germinis]